MAKKGENNASLEEADPIRRQSPAGIPQHPRMCSAHGSFRSKYPAISNPKEIEALQDWRAHGREKIRCARPGCASRTNGTNCGALNGGILHAALPIARLLRAGRSRGSMSRIAQRHRARAG